MTTQDLFSVVGKSVLITGGSRGIGLMMARGLVERGARVYVSSRKEAACEDAAAMLSRVGDCTALPGDVSTEDGCRLLAEVFGQRESALDVLINNAGATWGAALQDFDDAAWDRALGTNVKGVFHLTKFLLDRLLATTHGPASIINIGSIDGLRVPEAEVYSYAASKAAVHHLTRVLARRFAPDITVNAIAPGPFESKMTAGILAHRGDEIVAANPMGRIGVPDDMVGAAVFLASRAGSYITGQILAVDGGVAALA